MLNTLKKDRIHIHANYWITFPSFFLQNFHLQQK